MAAPTSWTFGELEAAISSYQCIVDRKRTAFQSRLKNLHRFNFPPGFKSSKGKASTYNAGDTFYMALAVEMTQMGLGPEHVVKILTDNKGIVQQGASFTASALLGRSPLDGDEFPDVFMFFDPAALSPLTFEKELTYHEAEVASRSLSFGTIHAIEEVLRIVGGRERLAVINTTKMMVNTALALLAHFFEPDRPEEENVAAVLAGYARAVHDWAESVMTDEDIRSVIRRLESTMNLPQGAITDVLTKSNELRRAAKSRETNPGGDNVSS